MRNKIIGILLAILPVSCSPEISQEDYIKRELPKYVWERRVEEGIRECISDYNERIHEYLEKEVERFSDEVQMAREKKTCHSATLGMVYDFMESWGIIEDSGAKEAQRMLDEYISRVDGSMNFFETDCDRISRLIESVPNYSALRDTLDKIFGNEDPRRLDYNTMLYNEFGTIDGYVPQDCFYYEDLCRVIRAFLYKTRTPSVYSLKFDRRDKIWKAQVDDDDETYYFIKVSVQKSGKVTMDVKKSIL